MLGKYVFDSLNAADLVSELLFYALDTDFYGLRLLVQELQAKGIIRSFAEHCFLPQFLEKLLVSEQFYNKRVVFSHEPQKVEVVVDENRLQKGVLLEKIGQLRGFEEFLEDFEGEIVNFQVI